MRKLIIRLVVTCAGFGLMAFSYFYFQHDVTANPWRNALMFIGKGQPASDTNGLDYLKVSVHLSPMPAEAQPFVEAARMQGAYVEKYFTFLSKPKLFLLPDMASCFNDEMLKSGRFPAADSNEILAGFQTPEQDEIKLGDQGFKIVGRLKKEVILFADSYITCGSANTASLFDPNQQNVEDAYVFRMPENPQADKPLLSRLETAFPKTEFITYAPLLRTEATPFYIYIAGLTLLLYSGSLALFQIYRMMATHLNDELLQALLREIIKHRRLFGILHLIYFGTVIFFALIVYEIPQFQMCFLAAIQTELTSGVGPLAVAFKAYTSKNILYAAAITLGVNFGLGSFLAITIPSLIIPGIGCLVALFRASMWGMLLSPGFEVLSAKMLPHSFTLLLEGEGYIVAAFFAVLVVSYLSNKEKGLTLLERYSNAFSINLKGNLLVALVLAVSAIYEAIEVIAAMP